MKMTLLSASVLARQAPQSASTVRVASSHPPVRRLIPLKLRPARHAPLASTRGRELHFAANARLANMPQLDLLPLYLRTARRAQSTTLAPAVSPKTRLALHSRAAQHWWGTPLQKALQSAQSITQARAGSGAARRVHIRGARESKASGVQSPILLL
jgi:hypothetical protein